VIGKYKDGRWSKIDQIPQEDLENATTIFTEFAKQLSESLNDTWPILLDRMEEISKSDLYGQHFKRIDWEKNTEGFDYRYQDETKSDPNPYYGGTAEFNRPNEYPTQPSGYVFNPQPPNFPHSSDKNRDE